MRLGELLETRLPESESSDMTFENMEVSDALFIFTKMADDGKLTNREMTIIEEMLEKILDGDEELDESDIVDHADTQGKRMANFVSSPTSSRIRNRLRQKRYRNRSDVRMKARKRAAVQKNCMGDRTAQLTAPGSTTFVCKLKDRMRSRLMQRVARRYG